jgi:xanthine dehydrogenase D subunit
MTRATTAPLAPRQPLTPAEPRPARPDAPVRGGVGTSARRPDGIPKVKGEFAYSSDLWAEGMLHGATVRSPHPHARIRSIDTSAARSMQGVRCVLTADDVPGSKVYGMEHKDQPVLAWDVVRYHGEPVAIVAADDPETARRAAEAVVVDYEVLEPIVDAEHAISSACTHELHPGTGNVTRHVHIEHGPQDPASREAAVVVRGTYEMGMQDQAFLGPESGLVFPAPDGGVDIYVATQWMHVDKWQVAPCLGLEDDQVRITLAGVGGAFGGREDLSMQVHGAMLALATQRPVRIVYSREESFFGHIHRHPARMEYEHGADSDGRLVYVNARIVLDGGAYTSSSTAVAGNAGRFALGPYECPSATIDSIVAYTNNPPCGAMRGFGAVQVALGHEAQMDKLAAALDMDPVELRIRNAMQQGSVMPTGQVVHNPAPVRELLEAVRDAPRRELPPVGERGEVDIRTLPGGAANTTHGEDVVRGVGYGVGFKNVGFAEGFDDYSTARVTLSRGASGPVVGVHTAAAEVGQGLVTVCMQIARTELPCGESVVLPATTEVGSAGSSSASRQTYMTGGAVKQSCELVRAQLLDRAATHAGVDRDSLRLADDGAIRGADDQLVIEDVTALLDEPIVVEAEYRHRETFPMDPRTGQGDADVQFAFAAHRAVVDVDQGLGIVRVLDMATAQDVGKAMNPQQLEGQIEGGTSHGVGLALMEEIQVENGKVRNPSFTDYLIPTILDMPTVQMTILELGDPEAPYGVRGVGEPPSISSTPAIAAAVRDATGVDVTRVPIRPDDIVFG